MTATRSGCKVGFSDDVQRSIPEPCAKCKGPHSKWWPWPGLWLCTSCFTATNSADFEKLIERLEVSLNDKN